MLKDMFNLTDEEALENLEFNLLWHHALRLTAMMRQETAIFVRKVRS